MENDSAFDYLMKRPTGAGRRHTGVINIANDPIRYRDHGHLTPPSRNRARLSSIQCNAARRCLLTAIPKNKTRL
jgi:hypothetical protein